MNLVIFLHHRHTEWVLCERNWSLAKFQPLGEISLSYMDIHDGFLEYSAGFSFISSSSPKMLFAFAVIVIYNVFQIFCN